MNKILSSPALRGQLRHVLTFVAGILVAKGKLTQELVDAIVGNVDVVINAMGALAGVVAAIWSAKAKKPDSGETQHILRNAP